MDRIEKTDFTWRFVKRDEWMLEYESPRTGKVWMTRVPAKEYDYFHHSGRLTQTYLKTLKWRCKRGL